MLMAERLPREEYLRDTREVARRLLGCTLVRRHEGIRLSGRIVEAEAYLGEKDLGAHPSRGRTPRVEAMYGPPGHAYVYFVYGMYYCLNAVTQPIGEPQAVLIRALEPIEGIEVMRERRRNPRTGRVPRDVDLADGPGKLCRALAIDLGLYGADLLGDEIWIEAEEPVPDQRICAGPRIGIDYAREWAKLPLRYWICDSEYVSH